jgi:hypothetical protein
MTCSGAALRPLVHPAVPQSTQVPARTGSGLVARRPTDYRPGMPDDTARGFSIDIGEILKDVTGTKRRTTRRRSTSSSSSDMDAALRRAVRAELADVERSLKLLADEVVRLRKANEALADQVAKLRRG